MKIQIVAFIMLAALCALCESKGGGGRGGGGRGGGSRGSGSRGSYSKNSGSGWTSWFGGKSGTGSKIAPQSKNSHYGWKSQHPGGGQYHASSYGSTFGSSGLGRNTYIGNNYYGGSRSMGGSSFLTYYLFFSKGRHHGGYGGYGSSSQYGRSWDDEDDRRWRATTQAPYFENKIPGTEIFLPAAAVVGAATAFGLASLLPLNVPIKKPLMYCNTTEVAQSPIRIEGIIYSCANSSVAMSCPRVLENSVMIDDCPNFLMMCDVEEFEEKEKLYCKNSTLLSNEQIFCNSTMSFDGANENEATTILYCFYGVLPEKSAAHIPTTTTEPPQTTEKELSIAAQVHTFMLFLIGKSHIIEPTTTGLPIDEDRFVEIVGSDVTEENSEPLWIPEALTMPPETTTTFIIDSDSIFVVYPNGTKERISK